MAATSGIEMLDGVRCRLGESPVWDARASCFIWTDIEARVIHRMAWPGREIVTMPMRARVSALGLCESGRLVVGYEDGVGLFDPASGEVSMLAAIEADNPHTRLNDGKVGPDGALWIGSMDERPDRQPIGALYRVTADGQVERKVGDLKVSNGLAWSPDGRTMFHTDSRSQWIDAWDFDAGTGAISNRRRIATPDDPTGRPDGGACDAEGGYWSAGISAGRLNRWSAEGELLTSVKLPTPHPTMPCFGGPDLRIVLVTSLQARPSTIPRPGACCCSISAWRARRSIVSVISEGQATTMRAIERLLITGAAGALGSHARKHFQGRFRHLRLSDMNEMGPAAPGEEVVRCNLADPFAVEDLCANVDAILHLGGRATEADWPTVRAANIEGAINVWEAARRHRVDRVLFASSNHAIGLYPRTRSIDHDDRTRPDSRYGASKAFGESLAELYAAKHGIRGFVMRIGSCFPEPVDARMLTTWLSYGDFIRLVEVGLSADYLFEIVYGVSANTRAGWWDNSNAHRLGYRPQDDAEAFADRIAHIRFEQAAAELTHGGPYVSAEFEGGDEAAFARLA